MRKAEKIFREFLIRKGMQMNLKRLSIFRTFHASKGHVSAEEIYDSVRDDGLRIGIATVWRTLRLIHRAGLAEEHYFGKAGVRYEKKKTPEIHGHIVCGECGQAVEFEMDQYLPMINKIANHIGFSVDVTGGVLLLTVLLAVTASADRRQFVWTYGYQTMPAGSAEFEHYFGYKLADRDFRDDGQYSHQLEIEVGITDRWDISVYQKFAQVNNSGFEYDGFKLRTRYRLFESGQYPVDPLLYLEVKRSADHADPTEVEGKLILARNYQQFFSAFNLVTERALGSGYEWEWKYDIGVGYQVIPAFSFGIESKGNFESGAEARQALGPTFSVARGTVWLSAGVLFPLNKYSSDMEFRYILGIFL